LELSRDEYSLQLIPGTDAALVKIPSDVPGSVPRHLADAIYEFFLPEQISHALLLRSSSVDDHRIAEFLGAQSAQSIQNVEKQLGRAAKSSPAYHLTFSLFTATGAPSSWEVQEALDKHVRPLVSALAAAVQVGIATQVQLYSSFSPSIKPYQTDDGWEIEKTDLTAFVNAAEWPLSPSIGTGPTINLIVYVPQPDQIPLGIEGGAGSGWLVPQWGAITIHNPPVSPDPINQQPSIPSHLSASDLEPAFEFFSSQLLSLLGVMEYEGHHSLPLRLRAHKRFTALALAAKASSGLASLARVANHLQQIPIPKHVAQLVDNSMANLTAFTTTSQDAHWNEAVEHAADAYIDSEKAFFDKSMVGQVYFPDEHKVAVYLPLLGPIGVPLLVGLMREVKRFIAARKAQPAPA
jgi:GPI-anchor transamidase subunit S